MTSAEDLIGPIRAALAGGDLESFADLLAPDVRWGAPGDSTSGCHNRRQVLQWWRSSQDAGVQADVVDVTAHGDKVLVHLVVSGSRTEGADGEPAELADRWQVLTIRDGLVADIRGHEDPDEAARAAST